MKEEPHLVAAAIRSLQVTDLFALSLAFAEKLLH